MKSGNRSTNPPKGGLKRKSAATGRSPKPKFFRSLIKRNTSFLGVVLRVDLFDQLVHFFVGLFSFFAVLVDKGKAGWLLLHLFVLGGADTRVTAEQKIENEERVDKAGKHRDQRQY